MRKRVGILITTLLLVSSCSSAPKKSSVIEMTALEGKRVALVSIDGEKTAQKVVEVALVNQLVDRGSFILVSKNQIEKAKGAIEQDPSDWLGLAKRAGADYALRVRVLHFDAIEQSGYQTEEVLDSQLAEETGTDGKTERVFKAKALDGKVQFELKFTEVANQHTTQGIAEAEERLEANAKTSSIQFPPRLRFLEKLSNQAFRDFFEKTQ